MASSLSRRAVLATLAASAAARGQEPEIPFVCPMDPEVRSAGPGKCPRCGMKLVAGIPDPHEFAVDFQLLPKIPRPKQPVQLRMRPRDPESGKPATLQLIHEKLLHLFLVSGDLSYFAHVHPAPESDGWFELKTTLPKAGEYRLLFDFFPEGATPQMIARTFYVPGTTAPSPLLKPNTSPQQGQNLSVALRVDPEQPLAGTKTMLFFQLSPSEGLEPYLGAWGHMLCASSDLIDLIHTHPAWEDKSDTIQFNVIFPRPGTHRVWVQFQRLGVVNTVAFNVPVAAI